MPTPGALAIVKELYPQGMPNVTYCYEKREDNEAAILRDQRHFSQRIDETKACRELTARAELCDELAAALVRLRRAFESDYEQMPEQSISLSWETNSMAIEQTDKALARYDAAKKQ